MAIYFTLISVIIVCCKYVCAQSDFYTGAVVEYHPMQPGAIYPVYILTNIERYEKHVTEAKNLGADIIVFPEYGLTSTDVNNSALEFYATVFPDPKNMTIACNNGNFSQILQRLSCIAKNNTIYLVVNLPEKVPDSNKVQKYIYYNTNIVFDRKGALIARYRKFNLFEEPYFSVTEKPELTYFTTDFGVTFGTFTCFDILFPPALDLLRSNENITDIVYPTAWFSELPFLTAVQTQDGWARANGVNLLAAGYSDPQKGNGGSGIYKRGADVDYFIPVRNETRVIVKKIKKIKRRTTPDSSNKKTNLGNNNTPPENLKLNVLKENMTRYESLLLKESQKNYGKCHNNLCCNFNVSFTPHTNVNYYYRLFVYDGMRPMGDTSNSVQICGVAACKNETIESCGDRIQNPSPITVFDEISISGDFLDKGNSVIFPTQVLFNLSLLEDTSYSFISVKKDTTQSINMRTTKKVRDVLGFAIYSVTKDTHDGGDGTGTSGWVIFLYVILALAVLVVIVGIGVFIVRSKNRNSFRNLFQEHDK